MDQTFQVPMQCCSLQHWTLLSPPDTSTTDHHFCFGPAASFFLELLVIALHSSPGAYWTSSDCRLIFQFHIFLPFHTAHGVLVTRVLEWFAIPSSSGPHCVRTVHYDCLSWVTLHGMAHSFTELCKPLSTTRLWSMKRTTPIYSPPNPTQGCLLDGGRSHANCEL